MKAKYFIPMFMIFVFAVLIAEQVQGAVTIVTPAVVGTAVTGTTYKFNVTTSQHYVTNCTFSTTANPHFARIYNTTANQSMFYTINNTVTALTEASATTLTVTCINKTGVSQTATLVIDVDNTNPTCLFALDRQQVNYLDAVGITVDDLSTDYSTITYAWVLYDMDKNSVSTSTSSEPNFNLQNLTKIGQYNLTVTLTDEVSKTKDCSLLFTVKKDSSGKDVLTITSPMVTPKKDYTPFFVIGIVLVLFLFMGIGYYAIESGKKHKRRRK